MQLETTPSYYNPTEPLMAFQAPPLPLFTRPRLELVMGGVPEKAEQPLLSSKPAAIPKSVPSMGKVPVPRPTFEQLLERIQSLQIRKRDLQDELNPRGGFRFFKRLSNRFNSEKTQQKEVQLRRVEASLKVATDKLEELRHRRSSQEDRFARHSWKMSMPAVA